MTWVGSLFDAAGGPEGEPRFFTLTELDRLIAPGRQDQGCPGGRRTSYFRRALLGLFGPSRRKIELAEARFPGSKAWYEDEFWRLVAVEPPSEYSLGLVWVTLPDSFTGDYWPLRVTMHDDDAIEKTRVKCRELHELESWNGLKGLFCNLRTAHHHKNWRLFDVVWPFVIASIPVLRIPCAGIRLNFSGSTYWFGSPLGDDRASKPLTKTSGSIGT
jgi:hypothetical protein